MRPDRLRSASPGYRGHRSGVPWPLPALQEKHLPFDVLTVELIDKMADEGNAGALPLIILPDLGSLGPEAADALDAFVRKGGNLVLTGGSGVERGGGIELATSPALMRVGTPMTGEELWSTYVTDSEQPEIDELPVCAVRSCRSMAAMPASSGSRASTRSAGSCRRRRSVRRRSATATPAATIPIRPARGRGQGCPDPLDRRAGPITSSAPPKCAIMSSTRSAARPGSGSLPSCRSRSS